MEEFDSLRLWWDVGKCQIRHFCQLYTASATAEARREIKRMEGSILIYKGNFWSEILRSRGKTWQK